MIYLHSLGLFRYTVNSSIINMQVKLHLYSYIYSLATQFFKWTLLVLNDRWIYRVNIAWIHLKTIWVLLELIFSDNCVFVICHDPFKSYLLHRSMLIYSFVRVFLPTMCCWKMCDVFNTYLYMQINVIFQQHCLTC